MTLLERHPVDSSSTCSIDVLIKEARQRQRRRRRLLLSGAVVVLLVVVTATVIFLAERRNQAGSRIQTTAARQRQTGGLRPVAGPQPKQPGPLAVASNGDLYIADDGRDQILELRNNRFTVAAGTGIAGFAGDGGLATKARIDRPGGMAIAPDGNLYFADTANGRVRMVTANGDIQTVAGNGSAGWVADGTPALEAALTPDAVTFSPSGEMYVADQYEVLRLSVGGTFVRVLGVSTSPLYLQGLYRGASALDATADDADGVAVDSNGDVFVSGFDGKVLIEVTPQGTLKFPLGVIGSLYPRWNGGLVTASDGSVLAMDELNVLRLRLNGAQTIFTTPPVKEAFLGIHGFSPDGIAVSKNGTIYLDTSYGNGFSSGSAIVALPPHGHPRLLWEQLPKPVRRS